MADHTENREVTIADVLAGRTQVTPQMKITAGQRLYYNYRLHQPSLKREIASRREPPLCRDFRSLRERQRDAARSRALAVGRHRTEGR